MDPLFVFFLVMQAESCLFHFMFYLFQVYPVPFEFFKPKSNFGLVNPLMPPRGLCSLPWPEWELVNSSIH
jgi:hypothetical protein